MDSVQKFSFITVSMPIVLTICFVTYNCKTVVNYYTIENTFAYKYIGCKINFL